MTIHFFRFTLHRLTLLFGPWAFVSLGAGLAAAGDDTSPIGSVRVDKPITVEESHGDTWVTAWTKDGNLYSPSDDTFGFRRMGNANIAFNRLEGDDVRRLHGTSVNMMADYGKSAQLGRDGCSWKSSGCYAVDGVLYWVVARHKYGETSGDAKMRQTAENASILKSADGGKTWTRLVKENYEHPTFPGRRFAAPYFIEYGRDGEATVDNADRYVYALSNNGFWDNGDNLTLGRVARSKIAKLSGSDWEFFRGGDGMDDAAWNADRHRAKLVLDAPGKLGMTGAVFIPALNRYLLIGWYYPAGSGKLKGASVRTIWDLYQSPKPWGLWTKIGSKEYRPQGYYSPQICPKFTSRDGRRLFAVTAGDWTNPRVYHLTIVPIQLDRRQNIWR
ncbi:MAG: DUF4185 domain-containing protein [Thermoguttaceae bacterium]